MISFARILTLLKKDVTWSFRNLKLLGIMVLPLFFVVLFSKSETTFFFSLIFVNVFIGLFSTSYLVIEEKNKGTLLSLLTSPLTSIELLLGKFLFNLCLCLAFSIIALVVNKRFDLLVNPFVLLNLALYAGMTCFIGYIIGVFFKNEQEMSVVAPMVMPLFFFGDLVQKFSENEHIYKFFPDYHFVQVLKNMDLSLAQSFLHTGFNFLYFLITLLGAALYTSFYFSNSREKRFSTTLIASLGGFVAALLLSGFTTPYFVEKSKLAEDLVVQEFSSKNWSGSFSYDPKKYRLDVLSSHQDSPRFLLAQGKIADGTGFVVSVREAKDDELTPETRIKKVRNNKKRYVLAFSKEMVQEKEFLKWTYFHEDSLIILSERHCGGQLLQVSLDLELKKSDKIRQLVKAYEALMETLKFECHQ